MKAFEQIAAAIAAHGVEVVFGVLGDGNLHVVYELVESHGLEYVKATREDAAVLMANGYARGERVGVATVTQGPALTHTMTALIEGVRSRCSVVVIAGDTSSSAVNHQQEVDQASIALAAGAGFQRVRSAATASLDVALAFRRARAERRPIVLDMPADVLVQDCDRASTLTLPVPQQSVQPDPDALDRAVGLLASARRPIVLAGWGAVQAGARAALVRLADRLGAPLATTLLAKDLFRGEPFDLGVFGTLSTPHTAEVIAEADCIVAFGAGLNHLTTAHGAYLSGRRVVHVDIDPTRIGVSTPIDAAVVGDAAVTARVMADWLDELDSPPSSFCSPELRDALASYDPSADIVDHSTDTTVDMRTVSIALESMLPPDRTLVVDGGRFIYAPLRYLHVHEPSGFLFPTGFGSIGLGLSTGIGAAFAQRDRPVVLAVGDGGLMASITELVTAVRHDLDLVVVVYNDCAYGAEHRNMLRDGMKPDLAWFDWPDLSVVAKSLGADAVTVHSLDDLPAVGKAIDGRSGPLLIDLRLDPDAPVGF